VFENRNAGSEEPAKPVFLIILAKYFVFIEIDFIFYRLGLGLGP
jgi:hypothetical protein